jgi:two-component system chemotaxis sensor kinase CheA
MAGLRDAGAIAPRPARKRLLVADDSVTVRTLQKNILESAGYHVTAAVDGMEAWHLLSENGADLVVSDVEMPRMDGISLTEAIRDSRRFRELPVILVTAMESDADKARGLAAGADAYCLKSAFDQKDLLATIARLL